MEGRERGGGYYRDTTDTSHDIILPTCMVCWLAAGLADWSNLFIARLWVVWAEKLIRDLANLVVVGEGFFKTPGLTLPSEHVNIYVYTLQTSHYTLHHTLH